MRLLSIHLTANLMDLIVSLKKSDLFEEESSKIVYHRFLNRIDKMRVSKKRIIDINVVCLHKTNGWVIWISYFF